MSASATHIVQRYWDAWSVRDKTAALACLAGNVELTVHIPQDTLPFGGLTVGRAAVSDRMQTSIEQFERLYYITTIITADAKRVRGRISFSVRHRMTGETIDGFARQIFEVKNGLITRIQEYHDTERLKAFMRLVSSTAADQQSAYMLSMQPPTALGHRSGDGPRIE